MLWPWGALIFLLFIISYIRSKKLFLQDGLFGVIVILSFIFIGIFSVSLRLPQNIPLHYVNHLYVQSAKPGILIGEVVEILKPGAYQDKYIVRARDLNGEPVSGKILLNISRDSLPQHYKIGDRIAIGSTITNINTPLNPYQFNYRQYMENLGVYRQVNASGNEVIFLKKEGRNIRALAGNLRDQIISGLREKDFKQEELAIIQALLLGQRQEISQEIYSNYAAAGVIHILAVSGLHVGIILIILHRLFKPLERLQYGRFLKTLLLLVLLWGFAIMAGLSPSVVRAVSMFSFVAIGMQLQRRTSVLNTLFMSLLVLLLINPFYILQVGFQLSYAAVFSIVLIQPHLYGLYKGNSRIIKYFWGILSVTIAAQIGVLPLSLFYFHQFPGLFFISNLVILPFLGIILGLGILVMLLSLFELLPEILAEGFGYIISSLNNFVSWAASREEFIFENIGFSLVLCLTAYLIVIGFILLLKDFRYRNMMYFLLAIIVFQASLFYERFRDEGKETLVFHKSRNTVIAFKEGRSLKLTHDLEEPPLSYSFIKDYVTGQNISSIQQYPSGDIFQTEGKILLRIDSSGVAEIPGLQPDLLLLTNSPRINLERVLQQSKPKMIIADGSNYPSVLARWKATALKKKIPFHATAEKGAFIINSSGVAPENN
ncbi:ComEC/Rec2 family competence protein [Antarcticibacterium arcticum]|uniref:ComEC/Rec2 family competence protein n=1 Tax=Antarcticibacterium arcticum TaxID=2585771 RepID=A0A5B8YKQ5_9FLAO|nr:ComEC/Rec2 family competence protein [Antarcticibacterium arcticum]QED38191.1 ComEC/Rec2 family competence protein [Antarcticibacterium arcticum]